MPEHFDAIVVGAGQAGPALCARLDKEGLKTALIERKLLGGTCVNNGCIPTKTLVASARAAVPDLPGVKGVPFYTNSSIMAVDFLPEHLVIVGGSYIGLEFAQMYRRFGSRVTVVERAPKVLPREDDDVAAEIRAILEREGIEIRAGAECMALKRKGARVLVTLECKEGEPVAE